MYNPNNTGSTGMNPSTGQLNSNPPIPPPGWQIATDSIGRFVYINPMTQQQSWTPPPGSVYMPQTEQQQQQPPPPPAPVIAPSLSNLSTSKSSLSSSMLPDGWEESTDAQGRVYYIDHLHKRTSWIHPNFSIQLQQQAAQQQQQQQQQPPPPPTSSASIPIQQKPVVTSNNNNSGGYYPSMSEYGYPSPPPHHSSTVVASSPTTQIKPQIVPPQRQPTQTIQQPQQPQQSFKAKLPSQRRTTSLFSQSAPLWDLEKTVPACSQCYLPFTVIRRRHHCRCCQREFCDACSLKRIAVPQFNHNDPVRVCVYCYIHTNDHNKTCVSRLVPYILDFHNDANEQYQALMEIYDFILSNQSNYEVIETALVGGLKPFLDYIVRKSKENLKGDSIAICCQILAFISKDHKLVKAINDPEHISVLFDLMSCSENSTVVFDCARILKNILSYIDKQNHQQKQQQQQQQQQQQTTPTTPVATIENANILNKFSSVVTKANICQIVALLEIISKESQLECLRILRVLAHDEEMLGLISQSNIIEVITPIISSNNGDNIKSTLKILTRLSIYDKKNAEKFYQFGGILFLIELLMKQLHPSINTISIKLLFSLSKTKLCSSAIAGVDGAIDIIMQLYASNSQLQETILLMLTQIIQFEINNQQLQKQLCNEQFIKNICQSLSRGNSNVESLSLSVLYFVSQNEQNKENLQSFGIIDTILALICDRGRKHAVPLEILSKLAFNNESVCQSIFEVGGLSVLIDIITTPPPTPSASNTTPPISPTIPYHDEELLQQQLQQQQQQQTQEQDEKSIEFKKVQYNAVKLIGNLSYSPSIVQEFVHFDSGAGIKALVALLNPSVDESLKQITSEALSNLCDNEACSILVLSEGGLTYSMALLSSSNPLIKTNALKLLQKLAIHSPEIKFVISEGASIRQIVEMLSNQTADIKKCAIYSLAEICKDNAANRDQAYKYGCLPLLINAFNTYVNDPKSLVCLLEIISGYASQSEQYRQLILGTDLVQSIIEYLFTATSGGNNNNNNHDSDQQEKDGFLMQSRVYCVLILSQLIKEGMNDHIRKIIDSGIILALVPLLSIKNSYLQEYTLKILKTITRSSSSDLRETLITSGILLPLSTLVSTTRNESIQTDSLSILIELSKNPECGNYLLETNAIALISELVNNAKSQVVRSLAIQLISMLFDSSSMNGNIWEIFTSKAGIPGLVALLSSSNTAAQITSANALSSIVVDGPGRARVVEAGGLTALIQSLSSDNINVACSSLVTILGLSLEDELCESIVGFGAMPPLLNILASKEYLSNNIGIDSKLYACETIFNLVSNAQCRPNIVDNKLIIQLLDLLFSDRDVYCAVSCKTLAVLASDPNTAKSVCEQGGIVGLVPILSLQPPSSPDQMASYENTLMSVAVVLTNLAKFNESSRSVILSCVGEAKSENDSLSLILSVLTRSQNLKIRLQLLDLLQILSEDKDFVNYLQTTTIQKLLSLLEQTDNNNNNSGEQSDQLLAIFKVLSVIIYISYMAEPRKILLDCGCLNHLVHLLSPPPEVLVSLDLSNNISLLDLTPTINQVSNGKEKSDAYKKIKIESIEDKEEINKISLNLIHTFSFSDRGMNEIRNSKLVKTILRFLDSKIEDQISTSLRIISNLSLSGLNRLEINSLGGMEKILDMFTTNSSGGNPFTPSVTLNVLTALYNMLFSADNFNLFIKRTNCFNILGQYLSLPNEPIQLYAAMIINRHLNQDKYAEQLSSTGVIQCLFAILSTASSENLIFYALKTIDELIYFDSSRQIICNSLPVEILKTIQSVPHQYLQELSKHILSSCGHL
ncbi:hypothetical protein DFA_02493 [Cavenderia fasciculata]|uniref:Uncharacterized protein n=1 Tax=Cavenderia fasciculata TaxID=261658 RepID=F4Q074_CACFS|nr:uncharacterized protein DFA_02493 [Cavenderia fasciculata]EGG18754.1 hypothetical protein DFA_02493 [Cavenderia fasciculata]|eukprot:XP_004357216.1 hypothetical protein DFA_02493 [Cavenderia fasciculata]